MNSAGPGFSLLELSDRSGFSPRTIHYYSAQGLLPPLGRRGAGARYPVETLGRLIAIRRMKAETRLTLQEIRQALDRVPVAQFQELARGDVASLPTLFRPETTISDATVAPEPAPSTPLPASTSPPASTSAPASPEVRPGRRLTDAPAATGPGEAPQQLDQLLAALQSVHARAVPHAGSRDHWLTVAVTPDLVISARRVAGEDVDTLRRVADYLRAFLVSRGTHAVREGRPGGEP